MQHVVSKRCWSAGLATLMALAVGTSATAAGQDDTSKPREHRSRDILAHIDEPPSEPGWIARHVAIDTDSGLRYSHAMRFGSRNVEMRLRGPAYRTAHDKLQYGLKLEVRF